MGRHRGWLRKGRRSGLAKEFAGTLLRQAMRSQRRDFRGGTFRHLSRFRRTVARSRLKGHDAYQDTDRKASHRQRLTLPLTTTLDRE